MSSDLKVETEAMPLNQRLDMGRIFNRHTILQNLAFVICVLFGVAMIANTQPPNDGGWYWYSAFLLSGKRLYSGMHLALQPLFVLESSAFLAVLGKGWLVSKIPALIHVVAYCLAFLILVRQSKLSDGRKAIVLVCAFFVSISFEAYTFSDYHVLTDCFQLYSLIVLLKLQKVSSARAGLILASLLGVLSGLALMTRLNDGAALFVGVVFGIVCLAPSKKLLSLVLCGLAAAVTVVVIVHLTGDSLHDYAMYSIFKAAGSKGGAGNVLTYPLHLPGNTLHWLHEYVNKRTVFYGVGVALIWAYLLRPLARKGRGWEQYVLAAMGVALIAFRSHQMYYAAKDIFLLIDLAGLGVFVAYGLGIWVAARFLWWLLRPGHADTWDHREILLLIPLGQLASGSMSSGGTHLGLFAPMAVMIVVLAICSPIRFKTEAPRDFLFALAVLLIFCTVSYRYSRPYSWHTYVEKPLFVNRMWYRHPDYGPMVIDRNLLQLVQPVCEHVRDGGADDELLSLPYSYVNYFCAVPPWHGYVQTFFDTSTKQTIQGLMDELQTAPPKWIFYQRQLHTLELHEMIFNQGKPLQQRYLDQLIEQKVADGTWKVVYSSDYGDRPVWDNHWFLIQTR